MKHIEQFASYEALIKNNPHPISILANTSAFLYTYLEDISWVGFYLFNDIDALYLGPFQGKIACTTIPLHKGVCGAAATTRNTVVVDDVHTFEGHIACDADTNSEVVIPIIIDNKLYGVLDVDSIAFARFDDSTVAFLTAVTKSLTQEIKQLIR